MNEENIRSAARSAFGAYDVLGYFVPGASLIGIIAMFEWFVRQAGLGLSIVPHTPVLAALQAVLAVSIDNSWLRQAVLVSSMLLATYVVGHLLASVAAIVLDRVYVARGYGYPLPYLLGKDSPTDAVVDQRMFIRAAMFWMNLYLILRFTADGIDAFSAAHEIDYSGSNFELAAHAVGVMILCVLVTFACLLLVDLGRPFSIKSLAESRNGQTVVRFFRAALRALSFPSRFVTGILSLFSGSSSQLDEGTRELFLTRMQSLVGSDNATRTSAAYWYAYIWLSRNDPSSIPPLENWLRLYSFARNFSSALYLAFCYTLIWWWLDADFVSNLRRGSAASVGPLVAIPPLLLAASFLMLHRYYYLYTDYYTKYLIRAFALAKKSPIE